MSNTADDIPRHRIARLAGLFYLTYIATFASSSFLFDNSVDWANAGSTQTLIPSPLLFRIGFTTEIISVVLFLLAAWALYVLLKPVNASLALLFLLINFAGVAVECSAALLHFGALQVAHDPDYAAFSTAQVQGLTALFLKLSASGAIITALLYGLWLVPLGWLVIKSGFLPRILGFLLLADGGCLVICFLQLCLLPAYKKFTYPLYPVMFIAEFGFSLYLLIKGAKERTLVTVAAAV